MEDITTVKVTPGFGDMEKINERKFSLSQMLEAPIFKSDMNAYYYNGKIIGLSVVMNLKTFVYGLFLAIDKTERSRESDARLFILSTTASMPAIRADIRGTIPASV